MNFSRKKKKSSNDRPELFEIGKVPPQAIDLEQAVLGALMLDRDALNNVLDILRWDSFYEPKHQLIFKVINYLFEQGFPVDILTVTQEIKKREQLELVGGAYYITQLTNRVASSANTEFHARIVTQKAIQRRYIATCTQIIKDAYEDNADVFDLMAQADDMIAEVGEFVISGSILSFDKRIENAVERIRAASTHEGMLGISTPYRKLNDAMNGWQKKLFYLIAARPRMGKTTMVCDIILHAALVENKPILFFSLEMTAEEIVDKLLSSYASIKFEDLKKGNLSNDEWNKLHDAKTFLKKYNIFIEDTAGLTISQIRGIAKKYKTRENVEMVIIDHIQKVAGDKENQNREQEVNMISDRCKNMAKDLDIPVISLAQLNRSVDNRKEDDKMPNLSDLRESGGLEQEADMVMFIMRPVVYGIVEDSEGNDLTNIAKVKLAKNRGGKEDEFKLIFEGDYQRFRNEENYDNPPYRTEPPQDPNKEIIVDNKIQPNEDFLRGNVNSNNAEDAPF